MLVPITCRDRALGKDLYVAAADRRNGCSKNDFFQYSHWSDDSLKRLWSAWCFNKTCSVYKNQRRLVFCFTTEHNLLEQEADTAFQNNMRDIGFENTILTLSSLLHLVNLMVNSKGSQHGSQSHTCRLQTSLPHNADTRRANTDSITKPPTHLHTHTHTLTHIDTFLTWPHELVFTQILRMNYKVPVTQC